MVRAIASSRASQAQSAKGLFPTEEMSEPRATKAVVLSLLTVLLAGGAIQGWFWSRPHNEADVSPMLSSGELMSYVTYKRVCRTSKDCEPPLACTADERVQNYRCLTSECMTDADCPSGFACRAARARPVVRFCKTLGTRREGERCFPDSPYKDMSCGAGLKCMRGICGRVCRLGDPGSCPLGFGCVDTPDSPACVSQCSRETCPPPKTCLRFDDELRICGTLVTGNCNETPCPEGQVCDQSTIGMGDKLATKCLSSCAPDKPCPSGNYCFGNMCKQLCQKDEDCDPLEQCVLYPDLKLSVCVLYGR